MGIYASDGSINVTVVDGSTFVGRQAADGSLNVVKSAGGVLTGIQHPSGALNVVPVSSPVTSAQSPSGGYYVSESASYQNGSLRVTVVAGNLNLGSPYSMAAASGNFAYTGNNTNLISHKVLAAALGTYALTGNVANLNYTPAGTTYTLAANGGSFTLTGSTMDPLLNRTMTAAQGSYTYTGNNATLTYTPGSSYTGPLDLAGFSSSWEYHGLRASTAAYAAALGNIIDVTAYNGGGSAVGSVLTMPSLSTGSLDTSGWAAWKSGVDALGAASYRCTKLYGQKGLFDLIPIGVSRGPIFGFDGGVSGTMPALHYDASIASPALISSTTLGTHNRPWTTAIAFRSMTDSSTNGTIIWFEKSVSSPGQPAYELHDFTAQFGFFRTAAGGGGHEDHGTSTWNDGNFRSVISAFNTGSGSGTYTVRENSTVFNADPTFTGETNLSSDVKVSVGAGGTINGSGFAFSHMKLFEVLYTDGIPSSGEQAALVSNQQAFGIIP